jgi:hypothetical protein
MRINTDKDTSSWKHVKPQGGTVKLITWIASSRKPHYDTLISSRVYYILENHTKAQGGRTSTQLHMHIYRSPEAKRNNRLWVNACYQVAAYTNFMSEALIVLAYYKRYEAAIT